jgi:uncharacterized metal-binding protein
MIALITCSGISNTGKLTTQTATLLMQRRPGQYIWMHAKQSAAMLDAEIGSAEKVIVLDGCTDCCATKKLAAAGHVPDCHLIATELGIEKNGMAGVRYDEIERVLAAIAAQVTEK